MLCATLQGTAAVALGGILASLPMLGKPLSDLTFLFFGAGEVRGALSLLIARKGRGKGISFFLLVPSLTVPCACTVGADESQGAEPTLLPPRLER